MLLTNIPERGNGEADQIILWRRKGSGKAEWEVVLAGVKKMKLGIVASLKIIIAIVILLQRMVRGNALWDAKLYAAMKAFSKWFAKIPLEGRTYKQKWFGRAGRIWEASGLAEEHIWRWKLWKVLFQNWLQFEVRINACLPLGRHK